MKSIKRVKLKNNLDLIIAPIPGTKTITILVMFKTGSKHENRENNGISHFLEHMFFKGTKKRPNTLDIASELDAIGGVYNAFTSKEYTGYWVKVDAKKINVALDVLSDMLINSKFEEEEIEREKGVIIEELNMYEDNPMMHIEDVFEECLYGDTPAGWDTIGTKQNIQNFKRDDFIDYFKAQYGVNGSVVCLAGNVNSDIKDKVEKVFKNFEDNNFKGSKKVIEKQIKPNLKTVFKKTDQTNLSLGVRTYAIEHKDEFVIRLISLILGGSMSSRLFTELRERRGLAYYVKTGEEFYTDSGYITTQAGVGVEHCEVAIKVILDEYRKLTKELVSLEELNRNKDLIRAKVIIQLEASDNVANWYGRQILFRKEILTPNEFLKVIKEVTPQDIRRVSKKIFVNNKLNLAIIGRVKDEKKLKSLLKI